jgi:hypothetical protein
MKILSGLVSIALVLSSSAQAASVLFSPTKGAQTYRGQQSYGLEIVADSWSDSDPEFADATYRSFKGYKTSQNAP